MDINTKLYKGQKVKYLPVNYPDIWTVKENSFTKTFFIEGFNLPFQKSDFGIVIESFQVGDKVKFVEGYADAGNVYEVYDTFGCDIRLKGYTCHHSINLFTLHEKASKSTEGITARVESLETRVEVLEQKPCAPEFKAGDEVQLIETGLGLENTLDLQAIYTIDYIGSDCYGNKFLSFKENSRIFKGKYFKPVEAFAVGDEVVYRGDCPYAEMSLKLGVIYTVREIHIGWIYLNGKDRLYDPIYFIKADPAIVSASYLKNSESYTFQFKRNRVYAPGDEVKFLPNDIYNSEVIYKVESILFRGDKISYRLKSVEGNNLCQPIDGERLTKAKTRKEIEAKLLEEAANKGFKVGKWVTMEKDSLLAYKILKMEVVHLTLDGPYVTAKINHPIEKEVSITRLHSIS